MSEMSMQVFSPDDIGHCIALEWRCRLSSLSVDSLCLDVLHVYGAQNRDIDSFEFFEEIRLIPCLL